MEWKIISIGEADYGCEERGDDEPLHCSVLLQNQDGQKRWLEVEDPWLRDRNLREGDFWPIPLT